MWDWIKNVLLASGDARRKDDGSGENEAREWMLDRGFLLVFDGAGYTPEFSRDTEYQFMRTGWKEPAVFRLCDQSPSFNICGLYYRPLGNVLAMKEPL